MLRILIVFLAAVVVIPSVGNGEWGTAGLAVVIAVVLLAMGAGERKDTRAWLNWRDYWAEGGPNRPRKTKMPYPAPAESGTAWTEMRHMGTVTPDRTWPPVCARCLGTVFNITEQTLGSGAVFRTYTCQACGEKKLIKM